MRALPYASRKERNSPVVLKDYRLRGKVAGRSKNFKLARAGEGPAGELDRKV